MEKRTPAAEPDAVMRARWGRDVLAAAGVGTQSTRAADSPFPDWLRAWLPGTRPAWAGLAAVWLLILFFNTTAPDVAQTASHRAPVIAPREMLMAFEAQSRLLEQWREPQEPPPTDRPPKTVPPRPRSERQFNRSCA